MIATKKKVKNYKRKRISVVNSVTTEKIKVILTIKAKSNSSSIYIDSPLLINMNRESKFWWPTKILDGLFEYRCGQNCRNIYIEKEISYNNTDFQSPYTKIEKGKNGIIATILEKDWFELSHVNIKKGKLYLVKLAFIEINNFGEIYFQYGDYKSKALNKNQIYMIFEGDPLNKLKLNLACHEILPYLINFRYITIAELNN